MELGAKAQWCLVGLAVVGICGLAWWAHHYLDMDLQPEPPQRVVDKELVHGVRLLREDVGQLTTKVDALVKELREGPAGLLETIDLIELGRVRFDKGSDVIEDPEQQCLAETARKVAQNGGRILVIGLADNCGRPTWNLNLSERRAQGVANWLRGSGMIPANQEIYVRGMGESLVVFGEPDCDDEGLRTARVVPLNTAAGQRVLAAVSGASTGVSPTDE